MIKINNCRNDIINSKHWGYNHIAKPKENFGAISGVSIAKSQPRRKKSEMDLALVDKAEGRVVKCKDKQDLFNQLGL